MKVYSVGPCDVSDYELEYVGECEWLVYWYNNYGYEGDGTAVALRSNGNVDVYNMSHCSCNGPLDGASDTCTLQEFLREPDSVHDPVYPTEVINKVRELTK